MADKLRELIAEWRKYEKERSYTAKAIVLCADELEAILGQTETKEEIGEIGEAMSDKLSGYELAVASKAMRGTVWLWDDTRNVYVNPTFQDWEAMAAALAEPGQPLDDPEAALAAEPPMPDKLREALDGLYKDSHFWSTRPCETCDAVSKAVGFPFGCDRLAGRKIAALAEPGQAKPAFDARAWLEARFPNFVKHLSPGHKTMVECVASSAHDEALQEAASGAQPTVELLAQFIRKIDGQHDMERKRGVEEYGKVKTQP